MLRILLADDHEIVRRGLKELLEEQAGWTVCAEAANGREAVELAVQSRPQVAILDFSMPELNGLEATRRIRQAVPSIEVLIFTMHESDEIMRDILAAGAKGYLLKSDARRLLIAAIESLAAHQPFFTGKVSEALLAGYLGHNRESMLSPREKNVVQLIAEGKSNKHIAELLNLSLKTVETHRSSAIRKLHLDSTAALVRYAVRNKLVEP